MAIQTPIRGLRSFCIAAKCLSFKHAASQLFLTPSAVSHQIKHLEDQLGTTLFHRNLRSIELTLAGKKFYQSVYPIITELENVVADFTVDRDNLGAYFNNNSSATSTGASITRTSVSPGASSCVSGKPHDS